MSDARLREFRYRNSTTFQTVFANAATTYWNTDNAVKLELTAYDATGLVQEGLEDPTLQTRLHQKGAPTPGLSKGELTFSTYLTGAETDLTGGAVPNMLRAIVGGRTAPTNARSTTATGGTTTNITLDAANSYVVAGQAVLVGVRGDGRGMGEARPINAVGTGWVGLTFAINAAASSGDALVFSDTIHLDETGNQEYFETLAIGAAAADQRQTIGAGATFEVGGMGMGERPTVDVTLAASDHRHVPVSDQSSFTHGTAPSGGTPAFSKAIGLFHMGDHGDTTRTAYKAGDFTFTPGLELEEQPDLAGVNGVGGLEQIMTTPTLEATLLYDQDMLGLKADFDAQTAKAGLLQLGHEATKAVAIELPKCYVDNLPEDAVIGNLAGVKVMVHGTEDFVDGDELASSVFKIHMF